MTEDSKTPEQMAEEYAEDCYKDSDYPPEILRHTKKATASVFLAGYQAAKDQVADTGKVMHQWIGVKERLPKEGQTVLLYNSLEYVSIVMANYYSASKHPFFDHITLDDIHLTIRLADNMHLYWMPLPEVPKDK